MPELGVIVYVSTNDDGNVKTVGIQPMLEQTVLYFSKERVVRAIQHGAVLKVAQSNGHVAGGDPVSPSRGAIWIDAHTGIVLR